MNDEYEMEYVATRLIHFIICILVAIFWGIGNSFYTIAFVFIRLMDKIEPESEFGNCWTFAVVKFLRHGGYLMCRPADGQRVLGVLPVPHVLWVKTLNRKSDVEQFVPIERKSSLWIPWHTVYYKGEVRKVESPHNAKEVHND